MAKPATRNRHLSEADDRFVEALLEEHARLGSGDDVALLALIRARTEEHPESGRSASAQSFGMRHWLQLAAVVTLIGLILTLAFQHFSPGHSSGKTGNNVVASAADSPAAQADPEIAYTIRIKDGIAAPHRDPQLPAIDGLGLPQGDPQSASISPLFATASPWRSPLTRPLSTLPLSEAASAEDSFTLEEIQSLLAKGQPLPAGAVTLSGLLRQLPLTMSPNDSERIQLTSAICPWNSDHRLVHVGVDSTIIRQAAGMFRQPKLVAEGRFPVFRQIDAVFPQSTVSPSATCAEIDRELIRIALAQLTEMVLEAEPGSSPELVIEFNPAQVSNYRLLGHATQEDGTLTALYELKASDHSASFAGAQPNLKYQPNAGSEDLLSAHLDEQDASIDRSQTTDWQQASDNLQVAAAAALFASMVENGQVPSREQADVLSGLLKDTAADSPEAAQLQSVISLWSSPR